MTRLHADEALRLAHVLDEPVYRADEVSVRGRVRARARARVWVRVRRLGGYLSSR